ncbi:MAG: hypothetical protein JKY23_00295 [Nitrospinaceae bacterium]|nr:hypothetical protein [Nitrospinaceae bacterium]
MSLRAIRAPAVYITPYLVAAATDTTKRDRSRRGKDQGLRGAVMLGRATKEVPPS